ncbi:MAG: hypothetical protein IKM26_08540 [Clostridia bacterium]|nr:hypothetical protein [Clostridia bacterium]
MFTSSRPIWAKGRSREINLHLEFNIALPAAAYAVRMTASTAYQLFADDDFIAYGPARAGDGHFRVDEWCVEGKKALKVLVAGYNTCCFQYTLYPSFLNLEVLDAAGNVLFATGRDEISAREYAPRLRWTDKQARQRVFTEVYDFNRTCGPLLETEVLPDPIYLPRRVAPFSNAVIESAALKDFTIVQRSEIPHLGELSNGGSPFNNKIRFLNHDLGADFDHKECCLFKEAWDIETVDPRPAKEGALAAGTARLFALDACRSGLIGLHVEAPCDAEIYLIFDELLIDGDITPRRSNCLDAVKYTLPAGTHKLLTFEPYCYKYIKVCVTKGEISLKKLYMLEQGGVETLKETFADSYLQMIYDAATNTYRQNATDIYMDCPSRERAGWLCDSFWTGRCEYALTGSNTVETNFLENYARNTGYYLPEDCLPGIVPMLYPGSSDFMPDRNWIINWNLWLIIEIAEYKLLRNGSSELTSQLKNLVYGILNALKPYENEMGLLENLPGWVFVEWSRANDTDLVCGVNYPSNMLYSGALEAAGRLYGDQAMIDKAYALRQTVRKYGFNGQFFVDNSVRKDGELVQTANTTEVCQYYAFFFHVADGESYPELKNIVLNGFGAHRKIKNDYPNVPFANAFIGNYMRMMILMEMGEYTQVLKDIRDYFGFMAEKTGSLWEYDTPRASCCHGFASYVALWLTELKEKLGL